jgi:site-specific recombinase XerC
MDSEDRFENNALRQQSDSWGGSWNTLAVEAHASIDEDWQIPDWIPGPILDSLPVIEDFRTLTMRGSSRHDDAALNKPIDLAEFVERRFVPEYVSTKRAAGRAHFQAILKHILTPERVARAFRANTRKSSAKLKAIPGWPYMDSLRLSDVKQENIQSLIAAALKAGYSTQTATHIRNVIRTLFSQAIRSGAFDGANPATYVKLPAMSRRETHALTLTQLKQVMQWMRYPEKEIALFALLADMNVAEICGLQWKYVNLSNESHILEEDSIPPRTIAVRKQSYRSEFGPVVGTRKRFIPIPELLHSILQQLKHRKTLTAPDDFVLASRTGTPIYPDNIAARRLKWIGTTLEIPWLSWHVFHRTRTKLMAEFGRHLNKELEKTLPLNPAAIPPPRGALKGEFRSKSKD